jgi:para-nitrobenzyl esterase
MLGGLTADEASGFSPLYGSTDPAAVAQGVAMFLGAAAPRLAGFYPTGTPQETAQSSKTMMQDASAGYFTTWADLRGAKARSPLYAYVFDHALPGPDSARYRAFHSAELPYLFGALDAAPARGFTSADRRLADQIQTYWVNFIKTGDPNGPGQAAWPTYDGRSAMILDVTSRPGAMIAPQAKWAAFKAFLAEGGTLPGF